MKPDLQFVRGLLWLAVAVASVATVGMAITGLSTGAMRLDDIPQPANFTANGLSMTKVSYHALVGGLSAGDISLLCIAPMLRALSWIVGGLLGDGILHAIASARPFTEGVERRLIALSILVTVCPTVVGCVQSIAQTQVLRHHGLTNDIFALNFALDGLLPGAVLGAVWYAFRQGRRLADDVEGLV